MGVLLLVGLYWFVIKKRNAQSAIFEAQVIQIDSIKEKLNNQKRMYGVDMVRTMGAFDQQAKRLEQMIPSRAAVPELLKSIASEAQNANVAYAGIHPLVSEPAQYYSKEVYSLQVSGGYREIGAYLSGIASLDRIVKPQDLSLTVNANAKPRPDGVPTLDAKFNIETYVIPSQSELVADSLKNKKKAGG
jgi:type IV pilus assembly protein PilO